MLKSSAVIKQFCSPQRFALLAVLRFAVIASLLATPPLWGQAGSAGTAQDVAVFPQLGHSGPISSVEYSPNGKYIVSGAWDKTVKIYNAESGREIRTLMGHSGPVDDVSYSPDGKYIASIAVVQTPDGQGNPMEVKIWEGNIGKEIKTIKIERGFGGSISYSPDGKCLAIAIDLTENSLIKIHDTISGKELKTIPCSFCAETPVAYSPDGKYIAAGTANGTVKIWQADNGLEILTINKAHLGNITTIAYSPDGKYIVTGSGLYSESVGYNFETKLDGTIKIWDALSGSEVKSFPCRSLITSIAYSPDGKFVAVGTVYTFISDLDVKDVKSQNIIKTIEIATGEEKIASVDHFGGVQAVAYSPDGKFIVSASVGIIKVSDASSGQEEKTLSGFTCTVNSANFSHDGNYFVSGYQKSDDPIIIWNVLTGSGVRTLEGHSGGIIDVTFSPDSKKIISGSYAPITKVWNLENGDGNIIDNTSAFLASSHDGKYIAFYKEQEASSDDNMSAVDIGTDIEIKEMTTGHVVATLKNDSSWKSNDISFALFSPDSKYLAVAYHDFSVKVWSVTTGKKIQTFSTTKAYIPHADFLAYSPDGKYLAASAGANGLSGFMLWDAVTGQEIVAIAEQIGYEFHSINYSPDGKYIVSCSPEENAIVLLDALTGQKIKTLTKSANAVFKVVYSPNGKFILSCHNDGTTRLWDAASGRELAQFIAFTDGEWIVITPDGYYNASPKGDQYLNVRVGNNVFGIDQYRERFYRPDIVKIALSGDLAAYDAAVKKAGASIHDAVLPPQVTISDAGEADAYGKIELTISIEDPARAVTNVWINVNGRLVAGRSASRGISTPDQGLSVSGKDRELFFTIPVDLDYGDNVIEVFASNGYAEGRAQVNRVSTFEREMPNLYILAIGINDYTDPMLSDLRYAVNDARSVVEVFKEQEGKRYAHVYSRLIVTGGETPPTAKAIRDSFAFFKQASGRDIVLLFVAGHAVNDENGNYFYCPSDARFTADGAIVAQSAISHKEINAVLDMSGQKIVFLDTCHSAGAGKTQIADANSFIREAMEYYPVIFSSSRGNELSAEDPKYQHGYFSWGIIEGMSGKAKSAVSGAITMKSLDSFVSEVVTELSNGRQNPITNTPNGYKNFVLGE